MPTQTQIANAHNKLLANFQQHSHTGIDAPKVDFNNLGNNPKTYVTRVLTYTPAAAAIATLDLSQGNIHHISMPAGNITIAILNGQTGQIFRIRILQDSVGSRTVTWFSTIRWAGGSAPTLTTTANKADTMEFEITGNATYDGIVWGADI